MNKFAIVAVALLGLGALSPAAMAHDRADAAVGILLGGTAGAAIGSSVGGDNGALLGSVIGAAVGYSVANDGQRRYYGPPRRYYRGPRVIRETRYVEVERYHRPRHNRSYRRGYRHGYDRGYHRGERHAWR